jgi:hypothetical protein
MIVAIFGTTISPYGGARLGVGKTWRTDLDMRQAYETSRKLSLAPMTSALQ